MPAYKGLKNSKIKKNELRRRCLLDGCNKKNGMDILKEVSCALCIVNPIIPLQKPEKAYHEP